MTDQNSIKTINSSFAPPEEITETEEDLLLDSTNSENADQILSDLVEQGYGIEPTLSKLAASMPSSSDVRGGDLDDNLYQAEVVGEEAVGGQTPTPDQNVTEQLLQAMGLSSVDGEPIHTRETFEQRDRARWELDPLSSEDYQDHS